MFENNLKFHSFFPPFIMVQKNVEVQNVMLYVLCI
jgi:hypothetical protein